MLHWFLPYNIMNQPYVCIYPFPLGPPSRLRTSHPSQSLQSTVLSSCYTVGPHWLCVLHLVVCVCQC